ncbi:protein YhfH [Ammoniphilus sp. CFH 90114]|nr:protein YhfH [Ammoniphilus sp. CFH 90114]RXT07845.1 YhfH family protein [Ammoniphilus sp. CFH 90114]
MIQSTTEFFRMLPSKCCTKCGNKINEQADCYTVTCEDCNDFQHYAIHQN